LTGFAANMTYLVEFAAHASRDLEVFYMEKNAADSQVAARWYNGLERAVAAFLGRLRKKLPTDWGSSEDKRRVSLWVRRK
jgi:hypothetical protein